MSNPTDRIVEEQQQAEQLVAPPAEHPPALRPRSPGASYCLCFLERQGGSAPGSA